MHRSRIRLTRARGVVGKPQPAPARVAFATVDRQRFQSLGPWRGSPAMRRGTRAPPRGERETNRKFSTHWWASVGDCHPEQCAKPWSPAALSVVRPGVPPAGSPERRPTRGIKTEVVTRRMIDVNGRNVTVQHKRANFAI